MRKFSTSDFSCEKVSIVLGKRLTKVKSVSIDKVVVKKSEAGNFSIGALIPILSQKFIQNIHVSKIIYEDKRICDFNLFSFRKLNLNHIVFKTNDQRKAFISTKIDQKGKLNVQATYGNFAISGRYDPLTEKIFAKFKNDCQELFSINGVLKENKFDGSIFAYKKNINISALLKNNSINLHCNLGNIFLDCVYDISVGQIRCDSLKIGDLIHTKPFVFSHELQADKINVGLAQGNVLIEGVDLKNLNFGQWQIKDIDVSKLFQKQTLMGILSGSAAFSDIKKKFSFNIVDARYGTLKLPAIAIQGSLSQKQIEAQASCDILGKKSTIKVLANPNNWLIDEKTYFAVSANGFFDLESAVKKIEGQAIRGRLKYDILAKGNFLDPSYSGNLTLTDGVFINANAGVFLKKIQMEAVIAKKEIIIKNISAIDDLKDHGNISGGGKITYINGEPHVDITIKINAIETLAMKEFSGKIFGNIRITGNTSRGVKIDGDLYSKDAKFDVSNFAKMATYAIEIIDSPKEKPTPKTKRNIPCDCQLNIKLKFLPNLRIIGFGIDSTWSGGISIYGPLSNFHYDFVTKLQVGEIHIVGKKFVLKNGTISCSDKTKGAFNVEVTATKTVDNMKVGAKFIQNDKGSNVVFFSKQYVSRNDVLSYILFDKSVSEISVNEVLNIVNIMGKLSGKRGLDIFDKMQTVFGLDSVGIKRGNNPETGETYTALSIGKKIKNVTVSINQGATKGTTEVDVGTEIAKNLKVSANLSGNNNIGAGIFWNKRY
jgi:autotransporter translocation and assembly factor TamB